jgi:hypothetical protein
VPIVVTGFSAGLTTGGCDRAGFRGQLLEPGFLGLGLRNPIRFGGINLKRTTTDGTAILPPSVQLRGAGHDNPAMTDGSGLIAFVTALQLIAAPHNDTIVRAFCDRTGAHVVYASGRTLLRRAGRGETCTDMRIGDQMKNAAWVFKAEATVSDDTRVLQRWTRERLFVDGVEVRYEDAGLYEWWFLEGGRRIVFEAGPLHGGGNMFLYDVQEQRVVERCMQRSVGVICPAWARRPNSP